MYIISGTNAANIREKQIDAPIAKLFIKGVLSTDTLLDSINPLKTILDMLNVSKISIQKQTPDGNKQILLPIGIGDLAEICSNSEGHISTVFNAATNKTSFSLTVELSNSGAISSSQGNFLLLSLDLVGTQIDSIDVYGVEVPVITENFNVYEQLKIQANTTKSINLLGKDLLAIPKTGFLQLDLVFPDRTVTYKDDIKAIPQAIENLLGLYVITNQSLLANNVGALAIGNSSAQSYYDSINFYVIGVAHCIEAKLTYTADANAIVVDEQ